MSNDKTYNGWTNYETWLVKLWMDNDQGSYNWNQERSAEAYSHAEASEHCTKEQNATEDLAKQMEEEYRDAMQDLFPKRNGSNACVWIDLLGAALSEVNWYEIAQSFIENEAEAHKV